MDAEQVYDIWGKDIRPRRVEKADVVRAQLLREMGASPVVEGATVNELWMKPCRRHPEGIYCVWAGNEVLVEPQPFPYAHGKLPFTQIGQIKRPGSQHYHASAVKYLRSGQMELNKYHAQKITNREAFANFKWWIPSELELEHPPTTRRRQILAATRRAAAAPEIIQASGFPDNRRRRVDHRGDDEHCRPARGEPGAGAGPRRVLEGHRAAEGVRRQPPGHAARHDQGRDQRGLLAAADARQAVRQRGADRPGVLARRAARGHRFKTQDIKPGLRVNVTMTTGLARSRAARQDQLMNYWDRGSSRDPR
jgi:hypothetical protein